MKATPIETRPATNHTRWIKCTTCFILFGVLIVFIRNSNQRISLFLKFTNTLTKKAEISRSKLNSIVETPRPQYFNFTTTATELTTKTIPNTKLTVKTTNEPSTSKPPLIVFWNKPFRRFPSYFPFDFCYPNNDCKLEYTSENAAEADVVVIHPLFSANLPPNPSEAFRNISNFRRKDQLFVFFQWESPEYHHDFIADKRTDLRMYDNFFDFTMTYRNDSGVKFPYGSAVTIKLMLYYEQRSPGELNHHKPVPIDRLAESDLSRFFQEYTIDYGSKQADVIAVISNCRSEYRSTWIKSLDKSFKKHGVNFHVYGNCANRYQPSRPDKNMFPSSKNGAQQYTLLPDVIKKFKFFLAIENSKCVDYITEKIFHNAYLSDAVPIVAGSAKKNYENWLPSDSFIHLDDFKSADEVAKYVKNVLNGGQERYLKYFDWLKRNPIFENYQFATKTDFSENYGWCKLCRLAKMKNRQHGVEIEARKSIADVHTWWYGSRDKLLREGPEKVCEKVRESDDSLVPEMVYDGKTFIKNKGKN